jgi:hypothetical protein
MWPVHQSKPLFFQITINVFIFLCGQENEPKKAARVTVYPFASAHRRGLWNSLRSDSHRPLIADGCDAQARDEGAKGVAFGSIGLIAWPQPIHVHYLNL